MEGMEIVPATRDHSEAIREIYNSEVRRSVATLDTEPRTMMEQGQWLAEHSERWPVYVALLKGQVVGFATLSQYQRGSGYRYTVEANVFVHQAERRSGLGSMLMVRLIEAARERRYRSLMVRIAAGDKAAMALPERYGFRQVSLEKEVAWKFDRWWDIATMQLILPTTGPDEPAATLAAST